MTILVLLKEFLTEAFSHLDLDWQKYVKTDKKLYRVLEVESLNGDSSKAKKHLKWEAKTKFKDLVKIMVDKDLERWQDWQKGKRFPWDAGNYIDKSTEPLRTRKK